MTFHVLNGLIDSSILSFTVFTCVRIINAFGVPFKRGFFCDDESLKHPYHDSTVDKSLDYIGYGLPITLIALTEFTRWKSSTSRMSNLKLFNRNIPLWAVNIYKYVGIFLFGASISVLTTDIAKHIIGRLRPHFFEVCHPVMPNGSDCTDPLNFNRYIEQFTCGNSASTASQLKDMRLSFPSGHSTFSMYTMLFAAIYSQRRIRWNGSKLLKHFLQYVMIILAWFTALSRISDYKHHCKANWMKVCTNVLTIWAQNNFSSSKVFLCNLVINKILADLIYFQGLMFSLDH